MSDDNHNNPSPEEQQLQGIKSKLGHVSGFVIAMRSEIADSFQKLHIQNQKHFLILQNKAEFHFYIMIIFIFFLFLKQNFKELSFIFSLLSYQNILELFNLLFKG